MADNRGGHTNPENQYDKNKNNNPTGEQTENKQSRQRDDEDDNRGGHTNPENQYDKRS